MAFFSDQAGSAVSESSNQPSIDERIKAALYPSTEDDALAVARQGEQDEGVAGEDTLSGDTGEIDQDDQEQGQQPQTKLVGTEAPWEQLKDAKVKVPLKNGDVEEVAEVSLDELRLGYMREKDYHAKRQEDAGKVRQFQQEAGQYVGRLQQGYAQSLHELEAFVQALAMGEFQGIDLQKLAADDPAGYVRAEARLKQLQTARGAIKQHLQQLAAQRESEQRQRMDQAQEQSEPQLKSRIPNWGEQLKEQMAQHAMKTYGFKATELAAITDHRVVELLHDAMKFRQQPDKKAIADKKVVDVPKVLTPGAKNGNQVASRDQELKTRIRKSGGNDKAAIEERIRMRL